MQNIRAITRLRLTAGEMQIMRDDVSGRAPEEGCGLLAGRRDGNTVHAEHVHVMENELHSPNRYRLDPQQLFEVLESVEEGGLEIVGIYHSHPLGPDRPSATDLDEAHYPAAVHLIWFFQEGRWDCRCYSIIGGAVALVELMISKKEHRPT